MKKEKRLTAARAARSMAKRALFVNRRKVVGGLPVSTSAGTSGPTIRFGRMEQKPIYDEPSEVIAGKDMVAVKGPDDVDVALTPEAAEKTSDRLLEGAMVARGKRLMEKLPHRPKR